MGFSLLEILIAVGLLATMVASLLPTVDVASRRSVEDTEFLSAVYLANNRMVALEQELGEDMARGKFPDETVQSGKFDEPFEGYSWEYSIKKVEIPVNSAATEGQNVAVIGVLNNIMKEISKAVREVKLTVSWVDVGAVERRYTLTTHIVNMP